MAQYFCCPRCGSKHLQQVTTTNTNVQTRGGGYSTGKGCLGWLLLGPLGLLCGTGGKKQETTVQTTTQTMWHCLDCGNQFKHPDDIRRCIEAGKSAKVITIVMGGIFALLPLMIAWISQLDFLWTVMLIFSLVIVAGTALGYYLNIKDIEQQEQNLREMEAAMEQFRLQALREERKASDVARNADTSDNPQ